MLHPTGVMIRFTKGQKYRKSGSLPIWRKCGQGTDAPRDRVSPPVLLRQLPDRE